MGAMGGRAGGRKTCVISKAISKETRDLCFGNDAPFA